MNRVKICGLNNWFNLSTRVVNFPKIEICHMGNTNTWYLGPHKILSEIVYIKECDEKFIYYNIKPSLFPNIRMLYFDNSIKYKTLIEWKEYSVKNKEFKGIFFKFNFNEEE